MPSFRYEVADDKGRVLSGTMEGETRHEIIERLTEQGYLVRGVAGVAPPPQVPHPPPPVQQPSPQIQAPQIVNPPVQQPVIQPILKQPARRSVEVPLQRAAPSPRRREEMAGAPGPTPVQVQRVKGKMTERDLYNFFAQLASLLRAGVGPVDALNGLAQRVRRPVLAQAAREMADAAVKGVAMSEVMARYEGFPSHAIGGIRAGEMSGFLPEAAEELAGLFQSSVAFKRHFWVTRISGWNLVLTVLFMMPFMPAFWHAFQAKSQSSEGVFHDIVSYYIYGLIHTAFPLGVVLFGGYYLGMFLLSFPKMLLWRHSLLLKVPWGIGARAALESMRVFAYTLRNNYAAALAPETAWNAAAAAVPNVALRDRFTRAGEVLRRGENIDRAALESGLFTHDQCAMLQTGRQAGDMVGMLEHITRMTAHEYDACQGRAKWGIWGAAIILLTIAVGAGMIMFAQGYYGQLEHQVEEYVKP